MKEESPPPPPYNINDKEEDKKVYKYNRKSKVANILKSKISEHLHHFSSDLHDDVLSEYITVLVCNGKTQNQARADLEDFLGKNTQEFVSWLWELLSKIELQVTASKSSHDPGDGNREEKNKSFHDPSNDDRVEANTNRKFRDLQSYVHDYSGNLTDKCEKIHGSSMQVYKSSNRVTSEHHSKKIMQISIQPNVPLRRQANGDTSMKLPLLAREHQTEQVDTEKASCAVRKDPPALLRRLPASLPGEIAAPEKHTSCKNPSEVLALKPYVVNDNKQQRSVWDRLGKPLQQVQSKGQRGDFHVIDKSHGTQHNEEQNGQCPPLLLTPNKKGPLPPLLPVSKQIGLLPSVTEQGNHWQRQVHWSSDEVGTKEIGDGGEAYNFDRTGSRVQSVTMSNIGRKRHFGEINENCTQAIVGMSKKKTSETLFANVSQYNEKEAVPPETSQAIISQVDDVKQRLRQMEIEMCKLRSKQIVKTDLMRNSGVVVPKEEDIDSRTVVVTNVHNKATKEILSRYFLKCGFVANVTILADDKNNMALPSGRSAYITFENKEAADKALAYSGASFFSRTIKVVRKGHLNGPTPAASQTPSKRVPFSPAKSIINPQGIPISGFNRQWRRCPVTSEQTQSYAKSATRSTC